MWLLSLIALSGTAEAAEGGATAPVLKMLGSLGIVLGLLLLLYFLLRKGAKFLPHAREGHIRIVETRPLGGRKFLFLVQVRGKEYLLGAGGDRIDFLAQTDEPPQRSFPEELKGRLGGDS